MEQNSKNQKQESVAWSFKLFKSAKQRIIPDFVKLYELDLSNETEFSQLTDHPHFFDTFLFPGEDEVSERMNAAIKEALEEAYGKTIVNPPKEENLQEIPEEFKSFGVAKSMIQKQVLKQFPHAYPVNAFIISQDSQVLSMILSHSDTLEARFGLIPLSFEDPENVLPDVLRFFYSHEITLTDENAVGILVLAQRLLCEELQEFALEYLRDSLSLNNSTRYLESLLKYSEGCTIFEDAFQNDDDACIGTKRFMEILSSFFSAHFKSFFSFSLKLTSLLDQSNVPTNAKIILGLPFKNFVPLLYSTKCFKQKDDSPLLSFVIFLYLNENACFNDNISSSTLSSDQIDSLLDHLGYLQAKIVLPLLKLSYTLNMVEFPNEGMHEFNKYSFKTLLSQTIDRFSTFFEKIYAKDHHYFSFLKENDFLSLISSPDLNVRDEFDVYKAVVGYISHKKPEISSQTIEKLKQQINLSFFSSKDLDFMLNIKKDLFSEKEIIQQFQDQNFPLFSFRKSLLNEIWIPSTENRLSKDSSVLFSYFSITDIENEHNDEFETTRILKLDESTIELLKQHRIIHFEEVGAPKLDFQEDSDHGYSDSFGGPEYVGFNHSWIIDFLIDENEMSNFEGEILGFQLFNSSSIQKFTLGLRNVPKSIKSVEDAIKYPSTYNIHFSCKNFGSDANGKRLLLFKQRFKKTFGHNIFCRMVITRAKATLVDANLRLTRSSNPKNEENAATKMIVTREHDKKTQKEQYFIPYIKFLTSATKYRALCCTAIDQTQQYFSKIIPSD